MNHVVVRPSVVLFIRMTNKMMDEQLLLRFLSHGCIPAEMRQIADWIAADPANAQWLFEMEEVWALKQEVKFSQRKQLDEAYKSFTSHLENEIPPKTISFIRFLKYAAAILLIGVLSTQLYLLREREPEMNTVEVPKGGHASLILSDGTKVWLNAQSKLTYPSHFTGKNRYVYLEGEGFFEVVRNEKHPFIIDSNLLNIKVLGTVFNVKAYPNEATVVTLAKGKVEVLIDALKKTIALQPNEQVLYSKEKGVEINKSVDISSLKQWTSGELLFINQPLNGILKELERQFDIVITIEDSILTDELFTCHTQKGVTIQQILTLFKETQLIDYREENKQIMIYKPKKKLPMK